MFDFRGAGVPQQHSHVPGLPKIETHGLPMDMSGGLRTAPAFGSFPTDFSFPDLCFDQGNTINPAQLHFGGGSPGAGTNSPYQQMFSGMSATQLMEEENNYDWMSGFDNTLSFANNENAIDGSSPSAMSTNTPEGMNEGTMDASHLGITNVSVGRTPMWASAFGNQAPSVSTSQTMDFSQGTFSGMAPAPAEVISPRTLIGQGSIGDQSFSPIPTLPLSLVSPHNLHQISGQSFDLPMNVDADTPTTSSDSNGSSLRHSSVTSISTDSINDSTRKALLHSLSKMPGFGERRSSQANMNSNSGSMSKGFTSSSFPSALDLQRYVSAYIQYFQPHLPFLHIPTLNFDSSAYRTVVKTPDGQTQRGPSGVAGGGGCLILAMAAIGALYEFEFNDSKELFEASKKLLGGYLEARRRKTMNRAQYNQSEPDTTPLWLVQAMLLNVIYGHNCGDKTSADIASVHCAALVSLARAAELARPDAIHEEDFLGEDEHFEDSDWVRWKKVEERKRTLYGVFILSSLLVSAYNHSPALTNSEIRLDIPCDETLWEADSAIKWKSLGGQASAQANSISFAYALSHLLTASQRQPSFCHLGTAPFGSGVGSDSINFSDLKPSTFGCLILINALHNYIWETRQRHLGPIWTKEETDQMHAHIEPALRAWQAAWSSNPAHSPERPNPFGLGPLSADSIPLLDLAYVRLFVNLGRSKEAFWQRDWDAMANELACGTEIIQHAEQMSPEGMGDAKPEHMNGHDEPHHISMLEPDLGLLDAPSHEQPNGGQVHLSGHINHTGHATRRERHLRKAAFYAADSLSHSDKLGISLAEHTSRELPLQSALCAFDCAQVLAEWITTVQERVGRYIGIIGQDNIDLGQIPAIMLLEEEDIKLIEKIREVLQSAEMKMTSASLSMQGFQVADVSSGEGGYGSKILIVTANMLERAAVWPVTKLMARCLETQAAHMKDRANNSIMGIS